MFVEFLKEMIKEKTYYKRFGNVMEIWQEKEKNTGKPYFIIKLLGSDKKVKEIELLKIIFKDSPDILEPLNEIDKEIERLNNIIKGLERWASNNYYINGDEVVEKIKELKGSDKE